MGPESTSNRPDGSSETPLIEISPSGDVVLNVSFRSTGKLKGGLKATRGTPGRDAQSARDFHIAYRVDHRMLMSKSEFMRKLFSDTRFAEGQKVSAFLARVSSSKLDVSKMAAAELVWIDMTEDDASIAFDGRELVFESLLRMLHGLAAPAPPSDESFLYATILAIMADRLSCAPAIAKAFQGTKIKWPIPVVYNNLKVSEVHARKQILVSWCVCSPVLAHRWTWPLLPRICHPRRRTDVSCSDNANCWLRLLQRSRQFMSGTYYLIRFGSRQWRDGVFDEDEPEPALWWNLPDGLEGELLLTDDATVTGANYDGIEELEFRRKNVLRALASVPRQFVRLYSSRERQCRLGYDSSPSCDSFQLGEIVKFLSNSALLFLVDFGPDALSDVPETWNYDIVSIVDKLKQCPSYQVDKNHTKCGMRTRIMPILSVLEMMVSEDALAILLVSWQRRHGASNPGSWLDAARARREDRTREDGFRWSRRYTAMAEGRSPTFGGSKLVLDIFTATTWDWIDPDEVQ